MAVLRRIAAVLVLTALFAFGAGTVSAFADAGNHCSPGQQGNPHPGFKPGNC